MKRDESGLEGLVLSVAEEGLNLKVLGLGLEGELAFLVAPMVE